MINLSLLTKYGIVRHLLRPTRGGAAGVLVVFAILLSVAATVGIAGIPLAFILISWFFKYAYVLFDHTVRGFDDPPTLDIQMINPFNEQRPVAQVLLLFFLGLSVKWTADHWGPAPAVILGLAATLLLPASVAVLGLECNLIKAANPVAWIRIVLGLGWMYVLLLAVITAYALVIGFLGRMELWLPVEIAIYMFCILSIFSALGGALYERRHELGLETWTSPEHIQARSDAQDLRHAERVATEAYGQARAGSHVQAWESLQNWLTARNHAPEDYRWLCARVAPWGDPRYVTRLTQEYVDRLLVLKRQGDALDAVAQRLKHDPTFRPKTAAATLQVARLAAAGGGSPRVARTLLTDFPARFPKDPTIPAAADLARQLAG